jgi:hypothetical protein
VKKSQSGMNRRSWIDTDKHRDRPMADQPPASAHRTNRIDQWTTDG